MNKLSIFLEGSRPFQNFLIIKTGASELLEGERGDSGFQSFSGGKKTVFYASPYFQTIAFPSLPSSLSAVRTEAFETESYK